MVGKIKGLFQQMNEEYGMAPLGVGRDARTWNECPDHYSMAKIIKKAVDPRGIMAPGVAMPIE
jgi:FAD/FMN-containing dehydrogenase